MRRIVRAIALLGVVAGCDDSLPPKSPVTIELAQSAITVIPGQIGPGPVRDPAVHVEFTVHRNGYTGPVALSAQAPPPITAPLQVTFTDPAPALTGAIAITVPAGTPGGDHEVTLRADASALGSVSATVTISVQPFSMWLYQSTVNVSRGSTSALTVNFTRDPSASVAFSVTSSPAGVTIVQSALSGNAAYLDISAAADAPLQTQSVTVTASGGGFSESKQFNIAVQSPSPKREIAFRMCRSRFIFFTNVGATHAYANEGEGWTTVVPDQDDMIRFQATERVRFAEKFSHTYNLYSGGPTTRVIDATAAELEAMQCASASTGTKHFTAQTAGTAAYQATLGGFKAYFPGGISPIGGARSGPQDLVAGARMSAAIPERRAIVRRGLDLSNGETIALDFGASEAVVLDSATHGLMPGAGEVASVVSRLHTPTTIGVIQTSFATQASARYWALPETQLLASDIQSVITELSNAQSGTARGSIHYFRAAQPLAPTLGPDLSVPVANPEAHTITLPSQTEYPDLAGVGYFHVIDGRGTYHQVELWQTKGFVGETPQTWTFTLPDLARFAAVPRLSSTTASAGAASGTASLFFGGTPAPGTALRWALRRSTRFAESLPFPSGR